MINVDIRPCDRTRTTSPWSIHITGFFYAGNTPVGATGDTRRMRQVTLASKAHQCTTNLAFTAFPKSPSCRESPLYRRESTSKGEPMFGEVKQSYVCCGSHLCLFMPSTKARSVSRIAVETSVEIIYMSWSRAIATWDSIDVSYIEALRCSCVVF